MILGEARAAALIQVNSPVLHSPGHRSGPSGGFRTILAVTAVRTRRRLADMPKVSPIGVDAIIEPTAEGFGEGERIAFLMKPNPEGDARAARRMIELGGVYPIMAQPGSHLGHRCRQIGAIRRTSTA